METYDFIVELKITFDVKDEDLLPEIYNELYACMDWMAMNGMFSRNLPIGQIKVEDWDCEVLRIENGIKFRDGEWKAKDDKWN